jgi:hypothetical protein
MSGLELLRTLIVGAVLLLLPGALLLRAFRSRVALLPEERPAVWFVLSLACFSPVGMATILRSVSLELVLGWWFATTALSAVAAGLCRERQRQKGGTGSSDAGARDCVGLPLAAMAVIALALLTYGAFCFTRGGSIDRWWYLAFVRSWLAENAVSARDPMLGAGTFLARFAGNAWLIALAAWSRVAAVEPFAVYERAAPLLLAPLAASATALATRVVLDSRRLAIAGIVVSTLFWTSGGIFPGLTRLPEDKLLAAVIVAPVLWALVVQAAQHEQDGRTRRGTHLFLVAAAAVALATTHPLVFGISLVTVTPALLLARPRAAVVLALVLMATAALPAALGTSALDHVAAGESIDAADHPVGRIHLARNRVRQVGDDLQVSSRMLARPLTAIAILAGIALALRTRRLRILLALPTALALALCFFPPLAASAARIVGPWMLYRFLWAIPFVPLLALVVGFTSRRTPVGIALPLVAAAVLAAPYVGDAIRRQAGPNRIALATPTVGVLPALAEALRKLPQDSVIAAAPELSERIPGLSGRRVLAASDRATIVFSETREDAERRLQSRAAVLAGLWLQPGSDPFPTHVLFEPGAPASRYCVREIFATTSHVLCEFDARDPLPVSSLREAAVPSDDGDAAPRIGFLAASDAAVEGRLDCRPDFTYGAGVVIFPRPGPWSARAPSAVCELRAGAGARGNAGADSSFRPRELELNLATGRADEYITILVRGVLRGSPRWTLSARRRVRDDELLRYSLPGDEVDRVDVSLLPSYLPFVKLRRFAVVLEPPETSSQ